MNLLIVEARYHPHIADALVEGAIVALDKGGASFERIAVPGALEIPTAIAMAARGHRFDGYVALGSVVQTGGIAPDIIAREATTALMRLGAEHILCIGNGIVAAASEAEALLIAQQGDAGGDAVRACLSLLQLRSRLS